MKGHTKIILTNVETGEQEIHEGENLITNALDRIIGIEMACNRNPNNRILPIATQALGGIMLFDEELEEDPENIHFPADVHLVGYANQAVFTADAFRGSYNAIESGKTDYGFKSVWDFGTTQANGVIKSVARTHTWGGQCPLYYPLSPEYYTTNNGSLATDRDWMPIRYQDDYVYLLKGNSSTHEMRLGRAKIPSIRMGAADYSDVVRSIEIVASWNTEVTTWSYRYGSEMRTVTVYADTPFSYEDGQDGYIYCMFYGPRRSDTEYDYDINYFTIKYSDESFEKSETIRLRTGTDYYSDRYYNDTYCADRFRGHVIKGNLYRYSANRKIIYKIPLNNVGAYSAIRVCSDDELDVVDNLAYSFFHNGCLSFEIQHYTENSYYFKEGLIYPDNTAIIIDNNYSRNNYRDHNNSDQYKRLRIIGEDLMCWYTYDSERICRGWAANYLGTINNLGTTITKTAAQTMKIIYTLTDVDSEDEDDE